ncbi:MAG TPA: hypothetical protein VEV18_04555 [Steroidobacteraceae bacterium]|nr:hypothetical protein [Steroidobacteraceae bacterium]
MVRSVLAILAGVVTLTAISFGIEALANPLLMKLFPASLPTQFALTHSLPVRLFGFAYGALSLAAGGYVTAWIGRRAPILHAALLGAVQTLLTVPAMIAMWNHAPAINWIVTLIMTFPACLLGGWLFARRAGRQLPSSAVSASG